MIKTSALVWQAGVVIASTPGRTRVRFEPLSGCQRCLQGEGCGAGVFSRLFMGRRAELEVVTAACPPAGQRVRVGVPAGALVGLAGLIYGLPVVVFILAAGAAASLASVDWARDLLGLAVGGLAAVLTVTVAGRRWSAVLNPRLEVLSASAGCRPDEIGRNQDG
ncbi:MAG: SoxR reducing system RseC family protein [Wenzhouxiangella sp.]